MFLLASTGQVRFYRFVFQFQLSSVIPICESFDVVFYSVIRAGNLALRVRPNKDNHESSFYLLLMYYSMTCVDYRKSVLVVLCDVHMGSSNGYDKFKL